MSDRVSVTLTTGTASAPTTGPKSARHFIVGQTGLGRVDAPVVVRSLTEYVTKFGPRTAGTAMYDAAELFLDNRAGELVVMRATGPTTVKATVSLSSSAIVVTAKNPGASYNAWTAAYTSATKTLTLVKGSVTANYTGTTAAELQTAAQVDADVTVTVSSLPGTDVSATPLASGTDDFANVVWATTLALIPDSFGAGSIAIPGVAYGTVGSALAAHAKTNRRLALLSTANGQTRAQVVTAMTTIAAYTGAENCVLVWPEVIVPSGATGVKTVDPTSFAAACRSITQRVFGVGDSPIRRDVAAKISMSVTPAVAISATDFTALVAAHVSFIRSLPAGVGMDNWHTATSPNANLYGAQLRDLANSAASDCADVLDKYAGQPATALVLSQAQSELAGELDSYRQWLWPEVSSDGSLVHPGYKVTVSNGASLADNRISAAVAMRFAESAEFIDLVISTTDATSLI